MAAAAAVGYGSASGSWAQLKGNYSRKNARNNYYYYYNNNNNKREFRVSCVSSAAVPVSDDPYKTLRIHPGASESEVKKAFRHLVLQYHPDVCRGSNCGVQFHQINEAYDIVMSNLRGEPSAPLMETSDYYDEDEQMRGMNDQDWDMWEEWMGWEGAGIRDYSSHINPYI